MTHIQQVQPPPNLFAILPEITLEEQADFAFNLGAAQQLGVCRVNIEKERQKAADQILEKCCEWLEKRGGLEDVASTLRVVCRPKPQSLKEQSIAVLDLIQEDQEPWQLEDLDVVRRALESIPESLQ